MYDNTQNGQAAAATAAPTPEAAAKVNGFRNLILDLLFASPVITAQEWATAVERTSNTENLETLAKWYRNAAAEISRRQAAAAPVVYATAQQRGDIIRLCNHPVFTRAYKTRVLRSLNTLTVETAAATICNLKAFIGQPFGGGAPGAAVAAAGGVDVSYAQAA